MTEPKYPYLSESSSQVPDRTDTTLIEHLSAEVAAQLANPAGWSVHVVNLDVGHGDLVNDEAAQQQIGDAAQALHTTVRGE